MAYAVFLTCDVTHTYLPPYTGTFFFLLLQKDVTHVFHTTPSPLNAFRMHWNMFIFIGEWSGLVPKSPRDAPKGCWHGRHVPRPRAARYTINDPLGTMWEYNGGCNVSLTGDRAVALNMSDRTFHT